VTRIPEVQPEHRDPQIDAILASREITPVQKRATGVVGHAPHMVKANTAFMTISMQGALLPRRLLELVRLRIAFHNQCRYCMAMRHQSGLDDGLTEDVVCSLEKPTEAPNLSEREKAALAYADLFVTNHFAINDETYAGLRKLFTDAQVVELGIFTGYFLGFGRFLASLDITEELPKVFQEEKSRKVGPWESTETVVVRGL
jgi:AhpD family alkylhydroperoxidase